MLPMLKNINTLPSESDATFLADYIELRALVSIDHNFARSEYESIVITDRSDVVTDRNMALQIWNNALLLCNARKYVFSKFYPFVVPEEESDVILLNDNLDRWHKCYLSLLIFSCLKYIDKSKAFHLTREFEVMCRDLLQFITPNGSIVKGNWPNPESGDDCYTGSLAERLKAVAKDIRSTENEATIDKQYGTGHSGDAGIDLVAWHGMFDERKGIPIAVGQCSCTTGDWKLKPYESLHQRHAEVFPLKQPWLNFYFCPLDLWKDNKHWRMEKDVRSAIFMDRYRILAVMENNNHPIQSDVVDEILG